MSRKWPLLQYFLCKQRHSSIHYLVGCPQVIFVLQYAILFLTERCIMLSFLRKWLGEWKTDQQDFQDRTAAYDKFLQQKEEEFKVRRAIAIDKLGEKWLMHTSNQVKRKGIPL